jgi:diadenylate cyclase
MTEILGAFGWRDAVDIALVAVVVYRVLVMFRGTRTAQMVIGLGVLVAASILARRLELHTIQWVLDQFWAFWAVALVGREAERARVVEEVSRAAQALASRRIGALVVIERTAALRQYADLGVALDALISADLLESIFQPVSPLHDGAALVHGDRIVAAGCFLPLSRNSDIARQLGTRHRAALGVSEETDAVAVAVSEETGHVSLAVDGGIEGIADVRGLGDRLDELLRGARPAIPGPVGVRTGARA